MMHERCFSMFIANEIITWSLGLWQEVLAGVGFDCTECVKFWHQLRSIHYSVGFHIRLCLNQDLQDYKDIQDKRMKYRVPFKNIHNVSLITISKRV